MLCGVVDQLETDGDAIALLLFVERFVDFELVEREHAITHDGIAEMLNPIAQDDKTGLTREHQVEHDVAMAEDEEIGSRMLLHILLGEEHLMLLVLAQKVRVFASCGTAVGTPAKGESGGQVGMNPTEHTLAHRAVEETGHPLEGYGIVPQAMSMSQIASLALNGVQAPLTMHLSTRLLLDIVENPDIVIPRKPMDLNALVSKFAQLTEEAGEASRHDILVFEPIVDDVTQEVESLAIGLDAVQETDHPPLVIQRMVERLGTEMHVADEINRLVGRRVGCLYRGGYFIHRRKTIENKDKEGIKLFKFRKYCNLLTGGKLMGVKRSYRFALVVNGHCYNESNRRLITRAFIC